MNLVVDGIIEQRVDREVTAPRILLHGSEFVVPENHILRGGCGLVGIHLFRSRSKMFRLFTECADLKNLLAVVQMHQTETPPDDHAALFPEYFFDLFRRGGCGKVVVFRLTVQQEIADGSADNIRLVSRVLQCGDDIRHILSDFRFQCHCLYGFVMIVSTPSSDGSRSG